MSEQNAMPQTETPPKKGTAAAIGFLIVYFLLATISAIFGLAVEGKQLADLDRQLLEAGQPPLDPARKSGMLVGYTLPNYVVPFLVAGLFAIGKKFRNRRSFAKIAMITSIVIFVSSLGSLGRMNQPQQQSREQRMEELKRLRERLPPPAP